MSGRTNPNFISTLSTSPTLRLIDGTDNLHSAIVDTLNIASGGNRVVRGFNITLGNAGVYTSYTLNGSDNFFLRDGILTQMQTGTVSQTVNMQSASDNTYAVLVIEAVYTSGLITGNQLAIRNNTNGNMVAPLNADDIPIAVVEIAGGSSPDAVDRKVQFLGYEQTNQGISIIDNNTETLRINKEGTITKTASGTETTVTIPSTTGTLALTSQIPTAASTRFNVDAAGDSNVFTDADHAKLNAIAANANNFSLPTAAANTLGGIKVGTNLSIDGSGVLSSTNTNTQISTSTVQGIVGAMFSGNTETGIDAVYQSSDGTIDLSLTTTDVDVSVSNLETRLAQINTATTIGNGVALTTGGDLTVTGDLTVSGATTTLNVANLAVEDNTIVLNKNQTGNSSTDAGIEVERGNYTNVQLKWNETSNRWTFTNDGNNYFNIPVTSELANPYVHPNYTTSNLNTTGAVIIDNISTNNTGHITQMGTRTLSLADLGYTGTTDANTYVHPNHSGDVTSSADGATTIGANKVTTAKINNSAVTTSKIADNAITNVKIDSNAAIAQSKIDGLVSALSGKEPSLTISDGLDRTSTTLKLDIDGLSNENGIDRTADFVAFHDNTVGLKKVNLANIFTKLTANDIPSLSGAYRAVGTKIINADIDNGANISADKIASGTTNKVFTSTLEAKLSGIEAGAEVNVNADWNSGSGDSQILNKPTIPSGNQIIDWTANGAGTIHTSNYVNTQYTIGDGELSQKNFTTALYDKLVGVAANANNFSLTTGAVTNAHLAGSIANSKLDDIAQSKVTGLTTALNSKVENLSDLSITASATELNILDGVSGVSSTEIGHLDGVTSSIQTQLNSKLSSLALAGLTDVSSFDTTISSHPSGSGIPSSLAVKTYVDGKATVDTTYSITTEDGLDADGNNDSAVKTIRLNDNTSGSGSVFHLAMGTGLAIQRSTESNTLTIFNTHTNNSTVSKATITPVLASYNGTETLNIGDTDNDTTVNIRGNLNVLGTTTTVNQTEVNVQNAFVFEGAVDNDFETTLSISEPTADRTITLPDITGTLITSADTGTISNGMIASTAISSAKISTNAVLTSKINASAVTTAKLASNAVTNAKLADDAVQTDSIADGAVTVGKITGLTDLGSGAVISSAERTKLSGIEASADVTDATNVTAAGAVMDGDFTSNGFMKRTGAGSYTVDNSNYLTSLSVTGLSDINAFDLDLSSVSSSDDSLASAKAIKAYVDSSVSGAGSFSSFNIKDGVGTTVNVTDGKFVQFTQGTGITATWTDTNSGASTDPFDLTLVNTGVLSNVAGTGIGVSGATGNVTITNTDLGSAQNIFKTIAVSGQDNIVADSNTDTLTLVGGANVNITTTAGSDTITIASTDTDTHLTQEEVEDYVSGLISAGSNITVQYADNAGSAGSLSIAGTANDNVSIDNLKARLNSDFGGDYTIGSQADDTLTVSGSLTVGADLIVSGDTITMNTSTLTVEDPLIALGSNNAADAVDLGFYGKYVDGSTIKYTGLFRDTSDSNKWKLFTDTGNTHAAPTTTINTTSGFTLGTLVAATFEGGLTGNATTASTLATARTIAGVSFNGSADIDIPINNLTGTLTAANGGTGLTSISTLLNSNVSLAVADLSDITSLDTDISSVSSSDNTLASAKAIKTYVDAQFAGAGSGDMTGVDITAGDAITVSQSNTTAGNYTATISVSGLGVAQLAGSALQISSESFNNNDTSLMTSAAIEDKILSYGYGVGTGDGDITSVIAGVGLSGGATTGDATLNLDFSELTDMTGDIAGTTEFIIQDGTTESRKAASEIKLSYFNNDSNWNNYVHPTGAGNNHIPTGGSAGQFLKYSSSGTASWATPSYTTEEQIEDFIAAMITAGTNITSTYDDTAGTLTLSSTDTNTQLSDAQVIAKTLTGFSIATNVTAVASSDSILVAFGKLEKRVAINDSKTTNSDTTYSEATSSDLGLVKIGYTESGKNYPVELTSGQMFVNVPWTDTNTNLNLLNDGTFSANSATSAASQQSIKTYVDTSVANLVASAPLALDTLNELAVALQSNDSDITGITTALGNRLRIDVNNQGLSSTQQGYALDNLGITASLTELNILDGGLSAGDIPNLNASKINDGVFASARIPTLNQNTTGTAAGLSSTLAISSGGTGATSAPMIGVVTAANAGAARTVLGLGTASTLSGTGAVANDNTGLVTGDVVFDYIATQNFASSGASNFVVGDITGQTELTSGLASTDELVLSDAGTLKRMDISVLQSYMQNELTFTTDTQRTAGALLDLNGNALDVDLSELTDMSESWVAGEDEFVVLDNGVQKKKLSSEIFGSNAFNSTAYLTAHPNINAANSVDNSGRTYIQDITLDGNGHITGIVSATETVTDSGNTTYGISAVDGSAVDEEIIRLTGTDSSTDDVVLEAGNGLSVARSGDKITFTNTVTDSGNTNYSIGIPNATTKLRLTGTNTVTDDVEFAGAGTVSVSRTSDSKFTITGTDTNVNTTYGISTLAGATGTSGQTRIRLTDSGGSSDDIVLAVSTGLSIANDNDVITLTNTNTGLSNATLLSKLNALESSSGTNDETINIGADSGDTINFRGNATIAGNLTVGGTTTTINTATIEVEDNILQLNTTQGSPDTATAATSGISIYRGVDSGDNPITQASLIFDDADDTWDLTNALTVGGSSGVTLGSGSISIKNSGSQSNIDFYCESGNSHYARLQAPAHSSFSGNHTITLPSSTGTLALENANTTGNADTATNLAGTTTAAFVYAGPTTGDAAAPTFRALLASDIPTLNQSTTGNADTATTATSATSATSATTATNVAGGVVGSIPYQTGSGATSLLAGNTTTTKKFLTQTGDNTDSAAPSWGTLATGDIPSLAAGKITSDTFADARISLSSVAQHLITGASQTKYLKMTTDASSVASLTARSDSQMLDDLGLSAAGKVAVAVGSPSNNTSGLIKITADNSGGLTSSLDTNTYLTSVSTSDIDNNAVTYAKMQEVSATSRVLGRISTNAGVVEELTAANLRTIIGIGAGTSTIENGATADQTATEILNLLEDNIDSVHYKDGSIDNVHLANSSITVSDSEGTPNTSPVALGGTLTFAGTANEVTVLESAGTITVGLPDDVTIAGNLTVTGDTIYHNETVRITENNKISFFATNAGGDDSSGDDGEVILEAQDPSNTDVTIKLPSTTGTLALVDTAKPVNHVYAGPSSGSTAVVPTFRSLVSADIPNLSMSKITSGTLAVARGGTGVTSIPMVGLITAADVEAVKTLLSYGNLAALDSVGASQITDNSVGAAELNVTGNGTSGYVLSSDADGSFSWVSQSATGIALSALSVGTEGTPSGNGGIAYDNSNGVFTYTPPLNITGNAASSTLAATTTVTDNNTSTVFPVVFHDESNSLLDDTGNFTYKPDTGEVRANFLTATFDANVSGSGRVAATTIASSTTISAATSLTTPLLTNTNALSISTTANNANITISPNGDGNVSVGTDSGSGLVNISSPIHKTGVHSALTETAHTSTASDPASASSGSYSYAQKRGITKIQGRISPLSSALSNGSNVAITVLPTGAVHGSNCSYRGIRGTLHIDAGITGSGNFVLTQDFIANDRDGTGIYAFVSSNAVFEGSSDFPFKVSWAEMASDDMQLKIENNTGGNIGTTFTVWWDLTLFPQV